MIIIKLASFIFSTVGSFELLRIVGKDKIDVHFYPSLTIAVQVSILFLAGIFNVLPEATLILYVIGLIGMFYSMWSNKSLLFGRAYCTWGYGTIGLILVIMAISVRGKFFLQYDNFSHWAMVVKSMLETDSFPTFKNNLIMFEEYPLGSAIYIYYFARMVGTNESIQMLAQIYMILAAVLPIFSFVKEKSIGMSVIFVVLANLLFTYNGSARDLTVDTLLPVVASCCMMYAYKNCINGSEQIEWCLLACYLVQIVQIKNSGVFFALVIGIWSAYQVIKTKSVKKNVFFLFVPFLSIFIWQKHCKYVFVDASATKHAMTIENYKNVFSAKNVEDIKLIVRGFIAFILTYKDFLIALGFLLAIGLALYVKRRECWGDYKCFLFFVSIIYVTYQLGMLGMYLVSMPLYEAIQLASIERYSRTIIIFNSIMTIVFLTQVIYSEFSPKWKRIAGSLVCAVGLCVFSYLTQGGIRLATDYSISREERPWIESVRAQYDIPNYDSYCMLIPEEDAGYSYYLQKYVFQSTHISEKIVEKIDDLTEISATYVFIYDENNDIINEWVAENYPEQKGNRVIIQ